MVSTGKPGETILTIFGAGGDLTWRKLMPAIYNLYLEDWMPEHFMVLGIDVKDMTDDKFRDKVKDGINNFSRRGKVKAEDWKKFAEHLQYKKMDFTKLENFKSLKSDIEKLEKDLDGSCDRVFYLATSSRFFEPISENISKSGLSDDSQSSRIVVEKPFGHDLESASKLNKHMTSFFDECQIYRIDHYLGKETVQNLMAFRFANALFEPIWNRNYIDHVQITVAEQVGVEHRGGYYDHAGALRDMIQNHLMQLFCLIAMEPPVNFNADEVRNKKVDVLHATRKIKPEQVPHFAVRGQYGPGWIEGKKMIGYRNEDGVDPKSKTESYAALKLYIDNWRWQGVPFYLRTGKHLLKQVSMITIQFRPVPHEAFPSETHVNLTPNRLILNIQPEKGIKLRFLAKDPGLQMILNPVEMQFNYEQQYESETPEAYETLLLDVMQGDATMFMRADQVNAAWDVLMPIINHWEATNPMDFPNYAAGTWGPEDAEALIAQDGNTWLMMPLENNHDSSSKSKK